MSDSSVTVDKVLHRIVESCQDRRLVLFTGAGVSMVPPSCAPSWWEIYASATKNLADRFHESFPEQGKKLNIEELLAPLQTQELADIISARFAGPAFAELLRVVDISDPNEVHRGIAVLCEADSIRAVLTTNFDTLIERASAARGVHFNVIAPRVAIGQSPSSVPLIKLHGTTVSSVSLIETTEQKSREIDPLLIQSWAGSLLEGADLLVLGYSGADLKFGATGRFFRDFMERGSEIFWLFRGNEQPTLTKDVRNRTTLIRGELPFPVSDIVKAMGGHDFDLPSTGRNAREILDREMEKWSKELHIGNWSSASLFLTLCEQGNAGEFRDLLIELATAQADRLQPGEEMSIQDLPSAGFLNFAGMSELRRLRGESAKHLIGASVNVFGNIDRSLSEGEPEEDLSFDERNNNLASSLSNLAHAHLATGGVNDAAPFLVKALHHSYLASSVKSFLTALHNILQYGFELRNIPRAFALTEAGKRLADRMGLVQQSIELRLLLAFYAFDRNEIRSALKWLDEASQISNSTNSGHLKAIEMMIGEGFLRMGRIREGLTRIAASCGDKATATLSRPIEELRRYLDTIGVSQEIPFVVHLKMEDVDNHVAVIQKELDAAQREGKLPWQAAHCSITGSDSKQLDLSLVSIGLHEFEGQPQRAGEIGVNLAQQAMQESRYLEARWHAMNVVANSDVAPTTMAQAHGQIAECSARLGYLSEAEDHLEIAHQLYGEGGLEPHSALAFTGLWMAVQMKNAENARSWSRVLLEIVASDSESRSILRHQLPWLMTHGDPIRSIIQEMVSQLGDVPSLSEGELSAPRFRVFNGVAEFELASDPKVLDTLAESQELFLNERYKDALEKIDSIASFGAIAPRDAASATELQTLAASRILASNEFRLFVRATRERLLRQLAFDSLARLELAVFASVSDDDRNTSKQWFSKHSWIGDLAFDPITRSRLEFGAAIQEFSSRQTGGSMHRLNRASLIADFFGLSDADLTSGNGVAEDAAAELKIHETLNLLFQSYAATDSRAEATTAMNDAIRTLFRSRHLHPELLGKILGDRGNWSLANGNFEDAKWFFRRAARIFGRRGSEVEQLQALAGEARASSWAGNYSESVALFEQALRRASGPLMPNLLLGLASTHAQEANRSPESRRVELIKQSVSLLDQVIDATDIGSFERPRAKLSKARCIGQLGDPKRAIELFDESVAELAHLGDPMAQQLLEQRHLVADGDWELIEFCGPVGEDSLGPP